MAGWGLVVVVKWGYIRGCHSGHNVGIMEWGLVEFSGRGV